MSSGRIGFYDSNTYNVIKETKSEVHSGTGLFTNERYELELMRHRVNECKSIAYGIQCIDSNGTHISTIVASKIYKTVWIPKLFYGVETMGI